MIVFARASIFVINETRLFGDPVPVVFTIGMRHLQAPSDFAHRE